MPPIRNPSLSKFHRPVGNKESLAALVLRLFSGHYDIMLNQPEFYHRPPPGLAPDPRLMPHRVWSLGPAVSSDTREKKFLERKRVLDPPWARPWLPAGTTDVRLLAGFC